MSEGGLVKITYIAFDGTETVLDVPEGFSVMLGARRRDLPGIVAECNGSCVCGTCHVFVDGAWRERVGSPSEMERAMLEFAQDPRPNSRLSCQIKVTAALDGLVVRMPESQP